MIEAADYILNALKIDKIDIAIVEGSGLTEISKYLIPNPVIIDLSNVPHAPLPAAQGHKKEILYGIVNGKRTIIFNGRIHTYDGYRTLH